MTNDLSGCWKKSHFFLLPFRLVLVHRRITCSNGVITIADDVLKIMIPLEGLSGACNLLLSRHLVWQYCSGTELPPNMSHKMSGKRKVREEQLTPTSCQDPAFVLRLLFSSTTTGNVALPLLGVIYAAVTSACVGFTNTWGWKERLRFVTFVSEIYNCKERWLPHHDPEVLFGMWWIRFLHFDVVYQVVEKKIIEFPTTNRVSSVHK